MSNSGRGKPSFLDQPKSTHVKEVKPRISPVAFLFLALILTYGAHIREKLRVLFFNTGDVICAGNVR